MVCPARCITAAAVRSYRTFSPLPASVRMRAVCFLWHFPSNGLESALPDVIRHTALWSSDFPLPASPPFPVKTQKATVRSSCQQNHYIWGGLRRSGFGLQPRRKPGCLKLLDDANLIVPIGRLGFHQHLTPALDTPALSLVACRQTDRAESFFSPKPEARKPKPAGGSSAGRLIGKRAARKRVCSSPQPESRSPVHERRRSHPNRAAVAVGE